jgi:hypothetical protein
MEKQRKRLEALLSRLEAKINKTRARTVVGILGKAKVASLAAPDPDDDPAISSFLRDTVAMAGRISRMGSGCSHERGRHPVSVAANSEPSSKSPSSWSV